MLTIIESADPISAALVGTEPFAEGYLDRAIERARSYAVAHRVQVTVFSRADTIVARFTPSGERADWWNLNL